MFAPAGVVGEVEDILPRGGQVGADGEVFGHVASSLDAARELGIRDAQVAGLHQQVADARVRARVAVAAALTEEQRATMRLAPGRSPVVGGPVGRR